MKNLTARQIGQDLKPIVDRLKVLANEERLCQGPDSEAIEIAVVNVDCAVEILTD